MIARLAIEISGGKRGTIPHDVKYHSFTKVIFRFDHIPPSAPGYYVDRWIATKRLTIQTVVPCYRGNIEFEARETNACLTIKAWVV